MAKARTGPLLRLALALGAGLQPLAPLILRRRLARGKELPGRWTEKLGQPGVARPEGQVIWLHAVGLGEVMALRGLIARLATARPDAHFLVTSTARSSAEALAGNLPARCIHQFLPLDMPGPVAGFLDHWQPDLAVWSEQDLWPRLVVECHSRGIPLALVNGRMNDRARKARARFGSAVADLYARFDLLIAQDPTSAANIADLAGGREVMVTGSLKSGAETLACDPDQLAEARSRIGVRPCWLAAPTHAEDEAVALAAQAELRRVQPDSLLILAPRVATRGKEVAEKAETMGLRTRRRGAGHWPEADTAVWVADTFAEMGLWYRLASAALIGGSFGPVEGHNPWEAVALECPVLHGPHTANFATDYGLLDAEGAARPVTGAKALSAALQDPNLGDMAGPAQALRRSAAGAVDDTARAVLELLP